MALSHSNTYVGKQAGYTANGDGNTALGTNAGFGSPGDNQVWIGVNANGDLTDVDRTVGIGANVGGGTDSVVIGFDAGKVMTGSDNTVIGAYAGDAITTSTGNVVIGKNAGTGLSSTSNNNVIIGNAAGDALNSGDDNNVVIGYNAFAINDAANRSVIIGVEAGNSYFGGSDNIAIGYLAAETQTAGTGNIAIGRANHTSTAGSNQLDIGNIDLTGSPNSISGFMAPSNDSDISGLALTITGTSAFNAAVTNQDGGDLILRGGQKASGGGVNGFTLVNDGVYCVMSVQGGSTAEITTDGTPRKVAAWNTDGICNGMTSDHTTGNDITADVAGTFLVNVQVSFTGSNAHTFDLELYDSGVATGFALQRKMSAGGDVGSGSIIGIVTLSATDTLELYHSTSDGNAFTAIEAQMTAHRISD
jgi:hypothetical protein